MDIEGLVPINKILLKRKKSVKSHGKSMLQRIGITTKTTMNMCLEKL